VSANKRSPVQLSFSRVRPGIPGACLLVHLIHRSGRGWSRRSAARPAECTKCGSRPQRYVLGSAGLWFRCDRRVKDEPAGTLPGRHRSTGAFFGGGLSAGKYSVEVRPGFGVASRTVQIAEIIRRVSISLRSGRSYSGGRRHRHFRFPCGQAAQ